MKTLCIISMTLLLSFVGGSSGIYGQTQSILDELCVSLDNTTYNNNSEFTPFGDREPFEGGPVLRSRPDPGGESVGGLVSVGDGLFVTLFFVAVFFAFLKRRTMLEKEE